MKRLSAPGHRSLRSSVDDGSRARRIVRLLRRDRPQAQIELDYRSPFQLLVATILSAQCTDARVNRVTPELLARYPDPAAMAGAPPSEVESLIRSTGFFRNKARSLIACSRALVDRHGGEVPRSLQELSALPGVGRKTANVVLAGAFGKAEGLVVDTHVARVARRLGLTRHDDPVRIEQDLMSVIPRRDWIFCSIALVLHGRYVCLARAPRCEACALRSVCPSRGQAVRPRPRRPRDRAQD